MWRGDLKMGANGRAGEGRRFARPNLVFTWKMALNTLVPEGHEHASEGSGALQVLGHGGT